MNEACVRVRGLTKTFGPVAAVTDLSFDVRPGLVTGFLGPNGAGKTTTMRMLLGLVTPTAGTATIGGARYRDLRWPTATVGSVLDTSGFHPGHTAHDHLRVYARMGGYGARRVREVGELTGVASFAGRRTGTLSTGMRQRLNLATALLGDPRVLLLDEPSNGLDPEGIAWLRQFLRGLAADGRAVLLSSHVLSEVEQTADQVVLVSAGRLVTAGPVAELVGPAAVLVRTPRAADLVTALRSARRLTREGPDTVRIEGLTTAAIADLAAAAGIPLHEIVPERPSLEQAFLQLTGGTR